jgi:hypothetical protein
VSAIDIALEPIVIAFTSTSRETIVAIFMGLMQLAITVGFA